MKFHPSMKRAHWSPQILVTKRNCVDNGYYEDKYIKYFCPKTPQPPLTSSYTYTRVVGIRKLIEKFVNLFQNKKVQFVNLGAGLDTISFWILNKFSNVICYDSDLEYQVKMKVDVILRTKELLDLFPNYKSTESTFSSERYNLFACDLSKVDELNKLKDFGFSEKLPTLYLNEFVLAYVPNDLANKVIRFLSSYSSAPSLFIFYELSMAKSYFMKKYYLDIVNKNCRTFSLTEFPTKESHKLRYKSLGWDNVFVNDLTFVYNNLLDKNERSRLRKIENFNDLKTLSLCLSHFIIGVAINNFPELSDFLKLFDKSYIKEPESDDELLPQYTEEELEKETDIDELINHINYWMNVTLNTDSDECKKFYNKFV